MAKRQSPAFVIGNRVVRTKEVEVSATTGAATAWEPDIENTTGPLVIHRHIISNEELQALEEGNRGGLSNLGICRRCTRSPLPPHLKL